MSHRSINLTDKLYEYLLAVSLREPAVLTELRHVTAKLPQYFMQISPDQGQFMALLVELLGAKKTLDIGVYTGYSALVVAMALPAQGKVIACDIDAEVTLIAQEFWQKAGMKDKIELRLAPALQTLDELIAQGEAGSFDFAFIDADKANYPFYYEKTLQLLRQGGLILLDNMLRGGAVADAAVNDKATVAIRAVNTKLLQDERVSISLIPVGDGLTLARKR